MLLLATQCAAVTEVAQQPVALADTGSGLYVAVGMRCIRCCITPTPAGRAPQGRWLGNA